MQHEFAYPTVRPLPPRLIDVAPKSALRSAAGIMSADTPASAHRARIDGVSGANVRARMQPSQTPRP
jgi:hypothetical protein